MNAALRAMMRNCPGEVAVQVVRENIVPSVAFSVRYLYFILSFVGTNQEVNVAALIRLYFNAFTFGVDEMSSC